MHDCNRVGGRWEPIQGCIWLVPEQLKQKRIDVNDVIVFMIVLNEYAICILNQGGTWNYLRPCIYGSGDFLMRKKVYYSRIKSLPQGCLLQRNTIVLNIVMR